jgi:hypothetical protein
MKTLSGRIILFVIFFAGYESFGQREENLSSFLANDTFCISYNSPKPLLKGTVVKVECDTAYLVNTTRFKTYEAAKRALIKSAGNKNYRELEEKYEAALRQQDLYYKELMKNYSNTDSLAAQMITSARNDLNALGARLESTRKILYDTDQKLDEVKKTLAQEKQTSRRQKIFAGFAGLGIGILIGLLVH